MRKVWGLVFWGLLTSALVLLVYTGCGSTQDPDAPRPPAAVSKSNDILDLLTGFGESISKRNFSRAVEYLIPEERSQIVASDGTVPEKMQKALMALPLQRLTRMATVRVEGGLLAGIYGLLTATDAFSPKDTTAESPTSNENPIEASPAEITETPTASGTMTEADSLALKKTIKSFMAAVKQKNWKAVTKLMDEEDIKPLLDEHNQLSKSAKRRLTNLNASNQSALTLKDGKLTGVMLLLPSE